MIDFQVLEDALFDLVNQSSGLGDTGIFISDQDGLSPQPQPYVTIRIGDLVNIGHPGTTYDYDATRPRGQEIVRSAGSLRDLVISFQAFTPEKVGSATARTILAKLQADLGLASFRDPLNAVGLGILDLGTVRWVPKINNTEFEGRAVLEIRCCIPQVAQDAIGYIETVNVTPTINGEALPIWPIKISD